nr:PREDICTED: coagulation factor VII [Lepisosteus oculatus]
MQQAQCCGRGQQRWQCMKPAVAEEFWTSEESLAFRSKRFSMLFQLLCLVSAVLCSFSATVPSAVLVSRDEAHGVLRRRPRANAGWLEELKMGNLERECMEEKCSYEEAREVYEHDEATNEFWTNYNVEKRCESNPCQNNGTCVNSQDAYTCFCPEGFNGRNCEEAIEDTLKCLYLNGGCEHFCNDTGGQRSCECAQGYALGEDGETCEPQDLYPCGKIPILKEDQSAKTDKSSDSRGRIVGGTECPKGHCPWQVLLEYNKKPFCGGVILTPYWVITASHCLEKLKAAYLKVVAGEHNIDKKEGTEQTIQVAKVIMHKKYRVQNTDNDIALLKLQEPIVYSAYAVPICLPQKELSERDLAAIRFSTVSGWGQMSENGPISPVLQMLEVPRQRSQDCREQSKINITDNMFCAGYFDGKQDSCKGDSGGPLVTRYKNTWFLTGIVSWGKGCARPGYYGIYTRVSNYLDWIQQNTATQSLKGNATVI